MDQLLALLWALVSDPLVTGIMGAAATFAIADLVVACGIAIRDHEFRGDMVAAWVETHGAARVIPIMVLAILGHANPALAALAVAALGTYGIETVSSIRQSLKVE